jgi:Xaa-Pro aminopeptidase
MSTKNSSKTDRVDRLLAELPGVDVELLLVTDLMNVRYLTGYSGSNGLALLGEQLRVFVTDFRYVEQAAEEVDPSFEQVHAVQDLIDSLPDLLPESELQLGFDDAHTSVKAHARLRELLPYHVDLVAASGLVEHLRVVKEPLEVEAMADAARIADDAFTALLEFGLRGRTERELALTLEVEMRRRGADGPSFPSIVAAGAHGALPHAQPRDVALADGDLVVIDWGALYQGYCSDCTRTVAVGRVDEEAREAYDLLLRAQLTGLEAVEVGGDGREIDATVREIIASAGHGERFGHGLGHGVGLEIHEAPTLSKRSTDTLQAGTVVTVEPGVYLPGKFGIRIEDLVVVQEGANRILTSLNKELQVVD